MCFDDTRQCLRAFLLANLLQAADITLNSDQTKQQHVTFMSSPVNQKEESNLCSPHSSGHCSGNRMPGLHRSRKGLLPASSQSSELNLRTCSQHHLGLSPKMISKAIHRPVSRNGTLRGGLTPPWDHSHKDST